MSNPSNITVPEDKMLKKLREQLQAATSLDEALKVIETAINETDLFTEVTSFGRMLLGLSLYQEVVTAYLQVRNAPTRVHRVELTTALKNFNMASTPTLAPPYSFELAAHMRLLNERFGKPGLTLAIITLEDARPLPAE